MKKDDKIDVLKTESKWAAKWTKLPLIYKILVIILIITLIFVPILMLPA